VQRLRTSVFLNFIAAGLYLGAVSVMLVLYLLRFAVTINGNVDALAALVGLGNWVVAIIGFGFGLAAPPQNAARGLGIATLAVAGTHLLLALTGLEVGYIEIGYGMHHYFHWGALVTNLGILQGLLGHFHSAALVPLLAMLLELARMILYALTLRAYAVTLGKYDLAGRCKVLWIGLAVIAGSLVVLGLLFGIIMDNTRSFDTIRVMGVMSTVVNYAGLLGMVIWYFFVVKSARDQL
jgi:hypothetical protein